MVALRPSFPEETARGRNGRGAFCAARRTEGGVSTTLPARLPALGDIRPASRRRARAAPGAGLL